MRVITVVGARPQFVKAAALERALRVLRARSGVEINHVLVHTGQHYDEGMSDVFFRELELSAPEHNLGVGSGPHGAQTAAMMARLEPILEEERPDVLVVVGDTNSTLAGALDAAKLGVPVAHVEAGLRSRRREMPEEINRVVVDHVASLLLCPSQEAVANLAAEGVTSGVHMVGDVMFDVLQWRIERACERHDPLHRLGLEPGRFVLATVHRAQNTDDPERLASIFSGLGEVAAAGIPVIVPLHPRTASRLDLGSERRVTVIDPVSYEECLLLAESAQIVATDSGGLQKEAYWLRTPCVTLREETEWPETVEVGWNRLVGADAALIAAAVCDSTVPAEHPELYGDGTAALRIWDLLIEADW